jgi:hypothetical protein
MFNLFESDDVMHGQNLQIRKNKECKIMTSHIYTKVLGGWKKPRIFVVNTVKPVYNISLGTLSLWPLLTDGCCSEVALRYKGSNWDSKIVVFVGRWSLFGGSR